MGQSQQEVNYPVLHRENTGYLKDFRDHHIVALGLTTISHTMRRVGFSWYSRAPSRPWPQDITDSAKLILGFRQRAVFLLHTLGLREKLPRPWPQPITGSASHVPGFRKGSTSQLHRSRPQHWASQGLALHGLLRLLFYTIQNHLPRSCTTHNGLGPPTSIINQSNVPQGYTHRPV